MILRGGNILCQLRQIFHLKMSFYTVCLCFRSQLHKVHRISYLFFVCIVSSLLLLFTIRRRRFCTEGILKLWKWNKCIKREEYDRQDDRQRILDEYILKGWQDTYKDKHRICMQWEILCYANGRNVTGSKRVFTNIWTLA